LTGIGRELGLVNDARWENFSKKSEGIELEKQRLASTWIQPKTPEGNKVDALVDQPISREYSLMDLIKRPNINYYDVAGIKGEASQDPQVAEQVEIQIKYSGYIDRQSGDINRLRRYENTVLPQDFDYHSVEGLSNEVKQKLSSARPETLARASRVQGVTPAAISLLLIFLKKHGALDRKSKSLS
jgi:tRNA uridine 5-carboxymethylaminomethyl modification enzyme